MVKNYRMSIHTIDAQRWIWNCVQNQITTHDTYPIRDKVAAFIITGGQDKVQTCGWRAYMLHTHCVGHSISLTKFTFLANILKKSFL
jgi:hypothetical protein